MSKRKILAAVLGLAAFGFVFAFAAGFSIADTGLSSGAQTVTTCVPAGGSVQTDYVIDNAGPVATGVHVSVWDSAPALSSACAGQVAHVTLYAGASPIANSEAEATITTNTANVVFPSPLTDAQVNSVTQVRVVIASS
jgi:hypothetical protein